MNGMQTAIRLLGLDGGRIAPEPAHGVGQDGAAMFAGVVAVAPDGFVVVLLELQGRLHLQIGEIPVAGSVVEIVGAVLQEDADVFLFGSCE